MGGEEVGEVGRAEGALASAWAYDVMAAVRRFFEPGAGVLHVSDRVHVGSRGYEKLTCATQMQASMAERGSQLTRSTWTLQTIREVKHTEDARLGKGGRRHWAD